jgi:hypothetical protein
MKQVEDEFGRIFSREAFDAYVADCPNIVAIQGYSPDIARNWTIEIDLYFEGSVHVNPILHENLLFWRKFMKRASVMSGHDYGGFWPDVSSEVDLLAKYTAAPVTVVDSLWWVPLGAKATSLEEQSPIVLKTDRTSLSFCSSYVSTLLKTKKPGWIRSSDQRFVRASDVRLEATSAQLKLGNDVYQIDKVTLELPILSNSAPNVGKLPFQSIICGSQGWRRDKWTPCRPLIYYTVFGDSETVKVAKS